MRAHYLFELEVFSGLVNIGAGHVRIAFYDVLVESAAQQPKLDPEFIRLIRHEVNKCTSRLAR